MNAVMYRLLCSCPGLHLETPAMPLTLHTAAAAAAAAAAHRRYRTQCIVSGVCTVVLLLLLLMQLGTVLSVWGHLQPRWPYLPLVLFQFANLAAVLVLQVGLDVCYRLY